MDDRREPDPAIVRRLIDAQFPAWRHLPLSRAAGDGWDNCTYRLGSALKVRLPRAARYAAQPAKEHHWLPRLAPLLPLPIPASLALGAHDDYPYHWSVQSWLPGATVAAASGAEPRLVAAELANFLRALQGVPATDGPLAGPHSFFRGGPLATYDAETRTSLAALPLGAAEFGAANELWEEALAAPWDGPPAWLHGDVAPGNLLVAGGRLAGVIDFGSCAVGDPACDLTIAWTFFSGPARAAFRARMAMSGDAWARARGWALWKALLLLAQDAPPKPGEASPRRVFADLLAETGQARKLR